MEKYGVVTQEPVEKLASEKGKCPKCGAELIKEANVPKCPIHGTAPFEESNEEKCGRS